MPRQYGAWSLALLLLITPGYAQHFTFQFPPVPSQCEISNVSWSGGAPPYKVYIAQIYGQLYQYGNYDAISGTGQIALPISAGQNYVVMMGDANGVGTGGSSEIQTSQPPSTSVASIEDCLTSNQNQVSLDFTFTVSGQAKQCARGFEMSWTGGKEDGPYNFTVIPLDQGFFPFDVPLEQGVDSMSDWMLNMTTGTRFTIMMNSAKGYGRGGVAGIYEVADSSDASCVVQASPSSTGSWPTNIQTNTLPSATLPITSGSNPSASSSPSSGGGISGGAIAGIVIGGIAVIAIVLLAIWFLVRRRRRREEGNEKIRPDPMDLGEAREGANVGEDDDTPTIVEPFPGTPTVASRYSMASRGNDGRSRGYRESSDESSPMGTFNPGNAYDLAGESTNSSGPGIAAALTGKTPAVPPPSTSSRGATDGIGAAPRKTDLEQSLAQPLIPRHQGQLRVVNHDDPSSLPAHHPIPAAGQESSPRNSSGGGGRRGSGVGQEGPSAAFRRHADAGRVQQEIVDLPPLYTDVPRDDDSPGSERRGL